MEGGSTPVQIGWRRGDPLDALLTREWLVTNALGGYASGTVGGACTRRFHGHLIAALPAPLGRVMMLNHLEETIEGPNDLCYRLSGEEIGMDRPIGHPEPDFLEEFVLERGVPVWRFAKNGIRIEKRVVMPHVQNTSYMIYKLIEGPPGLTLRLRPSLRFRPHEGLLSKELPTTWSVAAEGADGITIDDGADDYPPLRVAIFGHARLDHDVRTIGNVLYRIEKSRGYEYEGPLWSPGVIRLELVPGEDAGLVAS